MSHIKKSLLLALLSSTFFLCGCQSSLNPKTEGFIKIIAGVSFGMACLGGLVAIFGKSRDESRFISGGVGLVGAVIAVFLILVLIA